MASTNLSVTFGNVSFSAEADDSAWISKELEKFIKIAKEWPNHSAPILSPPGGVVSKAGLSGPASGAPVGTLAGYLKSKDATTNQVRRFLATADWLRLKGAEVLTTAMVSKALSDNQQSRLGNPAECLNKNVAKGHCEKTAGGFFITPEGLTELGYH